MNDVEVVRSAHSSIQKLQQQRAEKVKDVQCYKVLHARMTAVSSQIVISNMLKQAAEDLGDIDRKIGALNEALNGMPKLCSSCQGRGNEEGLQDPCTVCGGSGLGSDGIQKRAEALLSRPRMNL